MTLWLAENTIDAKNMLEHIVEKNERNVNLFLAEGPKTGLDELSELFTLNRYVVLGKPIGEQNGSAESLLLVDSREVLSCNAVDTFFRPLPLLFSDKSILE
jgi:hypothetical protein